MRRTMLLFLLAVLTSTAYASGEAENYASGEAEKTFRKLVEKYDVPDETKTVPADDAFSFWTTTLEYNELLRKFNKDITKNRGAEKEAAAKTRELPRFYPQYDETIVESMQGFCDSLLQDMGIRDLNLNCRLYVVDSPDVNTFTTLTEDGFAMCLTTGLLSKKGITREIIMGYVAGEFAHGALSHFERGFYETARAERRNKLLGVLAVGMNIASDAVAATWETGTDDALYQAYLDDKISRRQKEIDEAIKYDTLEFAQNYSSEQVFEADLIAYRFLENMGAEESVINGLRILGASNDALYKERDPQRPSIISRIDFLKFVQNNPDLGNKINVKLRK